MLGGSPKKEGTPLPGVPHWWTSGESILRGDGFPKPSDPPLALEMGCWWDPQLLIGESAVNLLVRLGDQCENPPF